MSHFVRVAVLLLAVVLPGTAHAVVGEENGPLYMLVLQGATQISQVAQSLAQAKEIYDETRKYVGMAQDAIDSFEQARAFGVSVMQTPDRALEGLFPDLVSIRGELQTPESWRQGTGELQRRVQVCLAGTDECGQFYERLRGQQAQDAISQTFGTVPPKRSDIGANDSEAAAALVKASINEGKSAVSNEKLNALLTKCTSGNITSCQAAANMASILEAKGVADLNEQVATSNRLQATQLANQSAEQKREALAAEQQKKAVLDGFDDMGRSLIRTSGEGEVSR